MRRWRRTNWRPSFASCIRMPSKPGAIWPRATIFRLAARCWMWAGGLAIGATRVCPQLRATVIDLPTVAPIARRFVEEAGVADRVRVVAADIVRESFEETFDVAVLKAVLQVFSADEARRVLQNVSAALTPGGVVYILGSGILDNSRVSPPEAVLFNLVFLNFYDEGQAYTEQEYRDWATDAGLEGFERAVLPDGSSILHARKPG